MSPPPFCAGFAFALALSCANAGAASAAETRNTAATTVETFMGPPLGWMGGQHAKANGYSAGAACFALGRRPHRGFGGEVVLVAAAVIDHARRPARRARPELEDARGE